MSRPGQAEPAAESPWEWVAAALSTLLVGAMIVFLLARARAPDSPAQVVLRAEQVVPGPGGYLLRVRAENRGTRTAAALRVEGVLEEGGAPAETSEATVDFVPGRSTASTTLVFRHDPRRYGVRLRVTGYSDP